MGLHFPPFAREWWQGVRPTALAQAIDTGKYMSYCTGLLATHLVRWFMNKAGIYPDVVAVLGWMEVGAFLTTFFQFFVRIIMRGFTAGDS